MFAGLGAKNPRQRLRLRAADGEMPGCRDAEFAVADRRANALT
jgi:hypothetical protein